MTEARVLAVSVGAVRALQWRGRVISTGIKKSPVRGPVEVTTTGLVGDEQGDRKHHGGPDKAVLIYPSEHYDAWEQELGELTPPAFGENFTTVGILESAVILGSVYEVGTAILQVTQPRRPCYRLAAYHNIEDLAVTTQRSGRTGLYCRVLQPGHVQAGDRIRLRSSPDHRITAAEAHRVLNIDRSDLPAIRRMLAHSEALPASWVAMLRRRTDGYLDEQTARLRGE